MKKCIACGKSVLLTDEFNGKTFCKTCSLKMHLPFWKNKLYSDMKELESQRDKIINNIVSQGFLEDAIACVKEYFAAEEQNGFAYGQDGGLGQTIKVYGNHCIINTDKNKFDIDEVSKEYVKTVNSTKPKTNFLSDPEFQRSLVKGLSSGRFLKTGIGLASTAFFDAARKEIIPEKAQITVQYTPVYVRYTDFSNIEFANAAGENIGYLRFFNGNNGAETIFFFRGTGKLKKRMPIIYAYINECLSKNISNNQLQNSLPYNSSSEHNIFDEIREYKNLLDDGIISQEEFEIKKKEILKL